MLQYEACKNIINASYNQRQGIFHLKGQSHEKVDELRIWGLSLGPN
jgi:hypothetical protein